MTTKRSGLGSMDDGGAVQVGVGIVGIGFMGSAHFHAFESVEGAEVRAIATRDRSKWSGDWRGISGNYGAAGGHADLAEVATYGSLEELLEDPGVDLVDICLPTVAHRAAAIRALESGRDVLVEKPIALTESDATDMLAAAQASGRRLFVAHVLHFMVPYRALSSVLAEPDLQILGLTMSRQVSTPWNQPHWRGKLEASGGPVFDLLVHDVDLLRATLGVPQRVTALGSLLGEYAVSYHVLADFGTDTGPVTLTGGICGLPGQPLQHGYVLNATDRRLVFDPAVSPEPLLARAGEGSERVTLPKGDPIVGELQYVIDALLGRHDGVLLAAEGAAASLAICVAVEQSILRGETTEISRT